MPGPIAEKGLICPLHKLDLSKVCHKCPWYMLIRGKDPQTTKEIDHWGCAISFLPLLQIEVAQVTRQASAEIHEFRNEHAEATLVLTASQDRKLLNG